jgi:hypothetical protein
VSGVISRDDKNIGCIPRCCSTLIADFLSRLTALIDASLFNDVDVFLVYSMTLFLNARAAV